MSELPEEQPVVESGMSYRRDADKGREPRLVAGRAGTRMYSLAALQERIEAQFTDEYADDSPVLLEADTTAKRLKLILEVVNYVLSVESVPLEAELKAQIIENIHANLFGYGVLDALMIDPTITTIDIHGASHLSVRRGHGDLENAGVIFDDELALRRVIQRLLADAGAQINESEPIVETGLTLGGRPVSMSVAMPPATPYIHVDMRLHPAQAPGLDDLVAVGWMTDEAAAMLRRIALSKYGFTVVSEPESGKTTLLNAMLALLPGDGIVSVERSGELRLPAGARCLTPVWRASYEETVTFGEQIEQALGQAPQMLVLDEVRFDEPLTILPLLANVETPRQIWSARGVTDAKRLQSGLGMLARRADMSRSEQMVAAFYERLPFVITVRNIQNRLQLFSIAEWQSRADSDYPDYVMLFQYRDGASRPTEARLARWLD
ncbi:MAG: ATPase, T2SS/T4P/T4SS family [Chloroflexota bacterium]|nr:ATPase, T2SS/T4P/T4SS family [Chloroflexota bacterium]